jgi:hypothetical protein
MRFLFILLLSICCRSGNKGVEFIEATQQRWVAGIRGGGAGINYEFSFKAFAPSGSLIFEGLWVGSDYLPFTASRPFPAFPSDGFKKGDTVLIQATRFLAVEGFVPPELEAKAPPYSYQGEALLTYTLKGKKKHCIVKGIKNIKKLEYE